MYIIIHRVIYSIYTPKYILIHTYIIRMTNNEQCACFGLKYVYTSKTYLYACRVRIEHLKTNTIYPSVCPDEDVTEYNLYNANDGLFTINVTGSDFQDNPNQALEGSLNFVNLVGFPGNEEAIIIELTHEQNVIGVAITTEKALSVTVSMFGSNALLYQMVRVVCLKYALQHYMLMVKTVRALEVLDII